MERHINAFELIMNPFFINLLSNILMRSSCLNNFSKNLDGFRILYFQCIKLDLWCNWL